MELSQGDAVATPSGSILASPTQDSVPVYVMLPLDTINADGVFRYANAKWFNAALQELKETGIHGVAVDVWVSGALSSLVSACVKLLSTSFHI